MNYEAPVWLPGGNVQTIWSALYARRFENVPPTFTRQRWTTPDADFIDVDWSVAPTLSHCVSSLLPEGANFAGGGSSQNCVPALSLGVSPLLVLFHGLEGSSGSHYAQSFAEFARQRGMAYCVPHFRGCSGEMNLAPRAYHSGDYEEIGWILARLRAMHAGPIVALGI